MSLTLTELKSVNADVTFRLCFVRRTVTFIQLNFNIIKYDLNHYCTFLRDDFTHSGHKVVSILCYFTWGFTGWKFEACMRILSVMIFVFLIVRIELLSVQEIVNGYPIVADKRNHTFPLFSSFLHLMQWENRDI